MLSQNVQLEGVHSSLMKVLQEELEWIELQQYTKDPHFVSLLDAIQNLVQFDDSLTDLAKNLVSKFYELSQYISQKFKLLIDVCILEVHSMQERALEIEKELYKQRDRAQSLQQAKQIQQKRLTQWEHEYETMKAEYNDVIAQLEQEKKRAKREWKEVKRTFLQVREDNENDRFMLQNLQTEKITITQKMQSQKKNNEMLLEEIQLLKNKVSETDRQVQSSAKKLSYEEKRVQKLEEELVEKDKLIAALRQQETITRIQLQQQNIGYSQLKEILEYEKKKEEIFNPKDMRQVSAVETYILAQDMCNQVEQFQPNFPRANSATMSVKSSMKSAISHEDVAINVSVIQQQIQPSDSRVDFQNSRRVAVPDFYFAHYLLTVQSIKLKLGQQDLFPIDLSGYYSEMINLGTPFHQWDEWIKIKLQQLVRKKS